MKVFHSQNHSAEQPQRRRTIQERTLPESLRQKLNEKAREIEWARAALRRVPDVRERKVAELREKIARGEYHVSPEKVAKQILSGEPPLS